MIVVSDTSCLCYLARLGVETVLPKTFGDVTVPPMVAAELTAGALLYPELQALLNAPWLHVVSLRSSVRSQQLAEDVDEGEAEAIALAEELKADYLLVDDAAGRACAAQLGIPIIGLLGVLLAGKQKGHINAVAPLIHQLVDSMGFRASASLVSRVLKLAGEDFAA